MTVKTDKKGNIIRFEYDTLKQLVKTTDPLNGMKQFIYDPIGNLTSKTDENGIKTTFAYDALNRLTAEIDTKGNQTKYQYNYLGLLVKKIDALNQETSFDYNELGKLVKLTDALGAMQHFEYDKNGNLTKETDQLGYSKTYRYDGLNRLLETLDALNQKTGYLYDPKGNLVQVTNPKGDLYRYEYDALDKVAKETNFLGATKSYNLDPNGNLTSQIDFNGNRTNYTYDKMNRLTEVAFADNSKKTFSYDPLGNLISAVNNTADEKFYYDELSRLTKAETKGLIGNQIKKVEFSYDKIGNPIVVSLSVENNGVRKVNYLYDDLNRLAKVTLPDGGKVEFTYDILNRVIERANANGTSMAYSYTPRSEVESIINYKDKWHRPDQVIGSYGYIYNAKGQRVYQVEGDGNLTAYEYDPAGQIAKVYYPFHDKKRIEDLKERMEYGLLPDCQEPFKFKLRLPNLRWDEQSDLEKQIQEFTDSFTGNTDDQKKNGKSKKEIELSSSNNASPFINNLNLDMVNRNKIESLYQKVHAGYGHLDLYKGFWSEEFSYDPNGNIAKKRNGWGKINYQYNQSNQLSQVGNKAYQYDLNGNTIKETLGKYKIDYTYNYENRLIKANSQFKHHFPNGPVEGEVSYGYDALGRKVKKEVNPLQGSKNEAEYYIYNGLGLDILADYQYELKQYGHGNSAGELERINEYYYGNGMLLASKEFDGSNRGHWDRDPLKDVSFYHQDALGSVVLVTDRNGHVDEKYQYDVWGKTYDGEFKDSFPGNGHPNNVYGFTGQRFEAELGIYSFPYRNYDPRIMRWTTEDPIKDGWNFYQYCGSDPINYIDLFGLLKTGSIEYGLTKMVVGGELNKQLEDNKDISKSDTKRATEITAQEMTNKEFSKLKDDKTSYKEKEKMLEDIAERVEKKLDNDPKNDLPDPERKKGDQGYTPKPGDKEIYEKVSKAIDELRGKDNDQCRNS